MIFEDIIGLIPCRSGSKGVINKNIRELGGQPLIAYPILDSLRTKQIKETYVSTDDEQISLIAQKYGAEVPFLRPKEYATDTSPDIEYAQHFIHWYNYKFEHYPQLLVVLRATTPFRDISLLDKAISHILEHPQATSLRSVELFDESPYKWFKKKGDYLYPLLNDDWNMHLLPRQNVPIAYRPNGYIDIYKPQQILQGQLCGTKILSFVTPKSVEIDTENNFRFAEYLVTLDDFT